MLGHAGTVDPFVLFIDTTLKNKKYILWKNSMQLIQKQQTISQALKLSLFMLLCDVHTKKGEK